MRILSSEGFKDFSGFISQGMSETLFEIRFVSGVSIRVTHNHRFMLNDRSWEYAENLIDGDELYGDTIESIHIVENEEVFDAVEVEDTHDYYTNGVISHNCNFLYIDEAAIIPNTVADEFFTATYPTISAGITTKIALTSTPLGLNHFWKFWTEAENGINGFVPVRVEYTEHPDRDEKWAKEQLQLLGELKYNQEVLMHFLGSAATLINSDAIQRMAVKKPLLSKDGLDVYYRPEPKRVYVMVVDTAKGVGGDYSAFQVIDITEAPYKVVAKYRDNLISPMLYPNMIYRVAKEYNEAHVLIEINSSEQVAHILYSELEYENIMFVSRGKSGQELSMGFGGTSLKMGVQTDKKVKRIGCQSLKTLIENGQLLIHDVDTISEISTFIERKGTYAADDGKHDDLVMPLVLFGWITTNNYFKNLTDINLREAMFKAKMEAIENDLLPVGFYSDGTEQLNTDGWVTV